MKISVISIAWNDLAGLKKTILSVQSQDYEDIEHIVIDGGSTDGTKAYLASLGNNIQWVSESDGGRYDAMNKGARMATGDLLWFLHSSDLFHSDIAVSFVAKEFLSSPFKWGHGLSRIIDGERLIGVGGKIPFDQARFLIGGHVIPHQAAVFTREFFWTQQGYDVNFGLSADQLFMMRASMIEKPVVWAEVLCDFDALGAGSTRGAWDHYRDMIRARKVSGILVTKNAASDQLFSMIYAGHTLFERVLRRVLRKSKPRTVDAGVK